MSVSVPLPFRIRIPSEESVDLDGQEVSVTYRLHGLLRLVDDKLVLEWIVRRRTETDSLTDGDVQLDQSPVGTASIPLAWIARGGSMPSRIFPVFVRDRSPCVSVAGTGN